MKNLINYSNFLYKCMDFEKNGLRFTYKTNKSLSTKIIKNYFDKFLEIFNNSNYHIELSKGQHNHSVKDKYLERLSTLFREHNYKENWIEQNIFSANVYQTYYGKQGRLMFSALKNNDFFVISPLFLDLNHVIYNNNQFDKKYYICLICSGKRCK